MLICKPDDAGSIMSVRSGQNEDPNFGILGLTNGSVQIVLLVERQIEHDNIDLRLSITGLTPASWRTTDTWSPGWSGSPEQ